MRPNDFTRFRDVMTGMAEMYGREMSNPLLDAYWLALGNWPLSAFEAAARHLMATSPFMPKPADFTALRKAGRPTAGEAWIIARAACGSCREVTAAGANYGSGGTCGDPLIDRAVNAIGGYRAIAMCDSDKLHFLERRFAEHFESLQDAEDVRAEIPQIPASFTPRNLVGPIGARDLLAKLEAANPTPKTKYARALPPPGANPRPKNPPPLPPAQEAS